MISGLELEFPFYFYLCWLVNSSFSYKFCSLVLIRSKGPPYIFIWIIVIEMGPFTIALSPHVWLDSAGNCIGPKINDRDSVLHNHVDESHFCILPSQQACYDVHLWGCDCWVLNFARLIQKTYRHTLSNYLSMFVNCDIMQLNKYNHYSKVIKTRHAFLFEIFASLSYLLEDTNLKPVQFNFFIYVSE